MTMIRPMVQSDIASVAACARAPDVEEMLASSGASIEQALAYGLEQSLRVWVIEHDGLPLAAVGDTMAGIGIGVPWMVTTVHVERHARGFLRASKALLQEAMQRHYRLVNYVDDRNAAAIRWLRWLGFEMHPAAPYGVAGLPFRKFEMFRR